MKVNNKMKAALCGTVALSMAGFMLSGCGGKDKTESAGSSSAPGVTASAQAAGQGGKASESPVTLSFHMFSNQPFDDTWAVFGEAAKQTNVSLNSAIAKTVTDKVEAFNLMMASGNIADIVTSTKANMDKFGQEGAFVPLNDLIDKHAPNLKKFLDSRPDVKSVATAPDGKMYFLPFVPDGEAATGWFIRQDWLDTLGLKVPTTVDEYYSVLKAFKEKDPNKNNKADEIPYFNRDAAVSVYGLLALWGADRDFFLKDGKIAYGPLEPEYKKGISSVAQWYKEGLIDREIFTRGGKARDILLGDNTGGSTRDWFASTAGYNVSLKDKVPGINFVPIKPPADINGKVVEYTARATVSTNGWGISKSNKHQVETIKYFDFWFTEAGRRLANFGVEGLTYNMVDGKPKFTAEILNSGAVTQTLWKYGVNVEFGSYHQDFEYERQYLNPTAAKGMSEYIDNKYPRPQIPALAYTKEEEARIKSLETNILTYVNETTQKWVLGAEAVEGKFDAFVAQLKTMGIEEVLKIKNDAYARYLKQ
ncbi:MAG: hypothetical protein K0R57_106 [Paenibacillaceae bacterium]|jgi:putative aldouronate transport system substrate-binding protein|nr:hypothetical protein [Paenibacillaceae bacterium]